MARMTNMKCILAGSLFIAASRSAVCSTYQFDYTEAFCEQYFSGDIASPNMPFNATDDITGSAPSRRIIDEAVTISTGFLWYEHGARGYHQHFISYSTTPELEIKGNFVITNKSYDSIADLIRNIDYLNPAYPGEI